MKSQTLNYERFCEQVAIMQEAGEKLTVRNILARTGGTTQTVAGYLKQWGQNAQKYPQSAIADEIVLAIMRDKELAIGKATEEHKAQINQLEAILQEVGDKCTTYELQLEAKSLELKMLNEQYIAKLAITEAKISMFEVKALELMALS
jgi:hypothetical protein